MNCLRNLRSQRATKLKMLLKMLLLLLLKGMRSQMTERSASPTWPWLRICSRRNSNRSRKERARPAQTRCLMDWNEQLPDWPTCTLLRKSTPKPSSCTKRWSTKKPSVRDSSAVASFHSCTTWSETACSIRMGKTARQSQSRSTSRQSTFCWVSWASPFSMTSPLSLSLQRRTSR